MPDQSSLRFTLSNIGPIEHADLELGNLTVISGRNNSGKSYIVYTLYGFLKTLSHIGSFPRLLDSRRRSKLPNFKQLLEQLIENHSVTLNAEASVLNDQRREILRILSDHFSKRNLANVFSTKSSEFQHAAINCELAIDQMNGDISNTSNEIDSGPFSLIHEKDEINIHYTPSVDNRDFLSFLNLNLLARLYARLLLDDFGISPFILSSERFGISLFYRELDFTKNQIVNLLQQLSSVEGDSRTNPLLFLDKSASRYALPIKDNIDYTRSLPDVQKSKSDFYEFDLSKGIRTMMDARFNVVSDEIKLISRKRSAAKKFNIPLYLASSSARGLSDFYFYLRNAATKNQLLIIDEPETHLDTANQVNVARLIANIVNSGIKVLITTHSDYIIKEFNNLIMLAKIESDSKRSKLMKSMKYSDFDALNADGIRAYIAKDGKLNRCVIDEYGLDMPIFDETINHINERSDELSSIIEDDLGRE